MHTQPLIQEIVRQYALPLEGRHGIFHWARVLENGLRLAEATGANIRVVTLFALFHDSRRINEHWDEGHGLRGGEFARSLKDTLLNLPDPEFDLFFKACRYHTDGLTEGDITLQVCWDADRLDLGRVGITPRPDKLCTDAARALLEWADRRAVEGYRSPLVAVDWGLRMR